MTYVGMSAKVEIAFVANPYSSALVWTDVTSRVAKLKTTTGRNYETGKNESSSVSLELRNNDGALNPMNTASPYYPYVLPFRPIRITASTITTTTTAGGGPAYPGALYPGGTSPGATTATAPTTTTTTGPSYPIWYGYVSSWPQSVKDQTSQYEMVNVVGVDAFKAVLGFVPGDPYDVKVRKDYGAYVDPGFSSGKWQLYNFDESAAPFATANGLSLITLAGLTGPSKTSPSPCRTSVVFNGSQGLNSQGGLLMVGEMWANHTTLPSSPGTAQIIASNGFTTNTNTLTAAYLSGIQPNPVVKMTAGISTVTFSTGLVVLANYVNLMPTDNSASFETSVSDWTSENTANVTIAQGTNANVGIKAMRATLTAAAGGIVSLNGRVPVTAGNYYTCSLSVAVSSTTAALNITFRWYNSSGVLISTTGLGGALTAVTAYQGQNTSPTVAPAGAVSVSVVLTPSLSSGTTATFDIDAIMLVGAATAAQLPQTQHIAYVAPSAGATTNMVAQFANTTSTADQYILPAPSTGVWHLYSWAPQYATTAPTAFFIDGVPQATQNTVSALNTSTGFQYLGATGYNGTANPGAGYIGQIAAVWDMTPATGLNIVNATYAAQHYNYGTTAAGAARSHDFAPELTSRRVYDVLASIGFPSAMTSLETGLTTMSASGNVSGVTATALLVAAAEAELGNVFVDRNGAVTFHNRNHRNSSANAATFGGDGNIPYEGNLVIGFDDTYVYNDVQITQANTSPTYVFEAQDMTSQNTYGVRTQQQTLQVAAQSDVQGMAATLLSRYKNPLPRLATLSIELRSKPNYIPNVFGLHIGDLITINHKPPGGTMFTLQCFIDGFSHTVDQGQWLVTLNTTPFYPNSTY